jgi:hypothetical protein
MNPLTLLRWYVARPPSGYPSTLERPLLADVHTEISNLRGWLPLRRSQDLAIFSDGLCRAGLPE